jgi:pimeloyl-ACP methyl ester carboxylesterase
LLKHKFESDLKAPAINKDALFLVAAQDTVIPVIHAKRLEKHWKGKVIYTEIPNVDHSSIIDSEEFFKNINMFLQ